MKVWIITIYEPLPFGGAETKPQRCGMLAKALLERGCIVNLWTSAFNHVSHKHIHKHSFVERVGDQMSIQFIKGCGYPNDLSPKRLFHNRQTAREFTQLAHNYKELPDIIVAPVPILELAEAAVSYARKQEIPIIVDIRDLWPDIYLTMIPEFMNTIGKKLLYFEYRRAKNVFRNATGITAVSEVYLQKGLFHAQRDIRNTDRFFPLGSEDVVRRSTSPNTMLDSIIQKQAIEHNKFTVIYVGTFSKFYDLETILDAAKLLASNVEIHLLIVGTGEQSEKFKKIAASLKNVTMTGWLNAIEMRLALDASDVGLVAYSKKAIMSLPNKPFEYMAAGLPLLSSLPGELAQLIEENMIGRYYEPGNPKSLAEEIVWFFEHAEETRKMGKKASEVFFQDFRSDVVYGRFSEYLEWIVTKHEKR